MIKRIDHIVITTTHLEQCLNFYKKIGFTYKGNRARHELYAGDFKINVHVKEYERSPHATNVQPGSADLCFEVTCEMEEFVAYLNNQGVDVELGPIKREGSKGQMESIYIRDPEGNLLEFCKY